MDSFLLRVMQALMPEASGMSGEAAWRPAADVYRTAHGWLVKFDLAGVKADEIQLTAKGSQLTVRGSRRDWSLSEECHCHQMEIAYSHFERTLGLPCDLERADMSADYKDGMLLVRIRVVGRPEGAH